MQSLFLMPFCSIRKAAGAAVLSIAAMFGASAQALPVSLQTPAGLNPGDRFRFVFVTSGEIYGSSGAIDATSTDIDTYNTFVATEAGGATYGNSVVSWKAIGSTATVNARDNVGGYGTAVAIYLVDGTRVANDLTTNTDGFWSGSLLQGPPRTKIDLTIDGIVNNNYVWTGSINDGTTYSGYELGSGSYTEHGDSNSTGGFLDYDNTDGSYTMPMFGMSSELTVLSAVPEIDPAGASSVLALVAGAVGLLERRARRIRA